jgi:hypothetical protein
MFSLREINYPASDALAAVCQVLARIVSVVSAVALFFVSALNVLADRVNFGKFQLTTASGQSSTYSADFAVDGIVSNFHSFRTSNTSNPHTLELWFPRPVAIGSAHLYIGLDNDPAQGGLPSFKLQSHNGNQWIDIPGASVTENTSAERSVIFTAAVTSDRFRLYSDENGSRVIREMALFPPNLLSGVEQGFPIGTDVNLSLTHMRPAEGTTINAGAFPKRAVDGFLDDTSRWVSSNLADQSIVIDLLAPHLIGSAHLYSGFGQTSPQSAFKLQSWDGTDWQDIPGATFTGNTSNALVIPFSSNVTTSLVRLLNTAASFTRVKELLLFPPRVGGYPLGQDVKVGSPPAVNWAEYEENSYELRNAVAEERLLGHHDGSVRYSTSAQPRAALGWQLLLNHRDGSYRVRHLATGQCLALAEISAEANNPVILENYTGMPHQDWFLQRIDATHFRIINLHSGLALQVGAGDTMVVAPVNPTSDLQLWYTQNPVLPFKKGIAASAALFPNSTESWIASSWPLFNAASSTSWAYSWGRQTAATFPFIGPNQTFHPMQWSGNMNHGLSVGPMEYLRRELNGSPKPVHVMGFNEPDKTEQGNVTVDNAIALWPRLESLGMPLVAPAPANMFGGWYEDFKAKADARGLRYDYTPVHWYSSPDLTNAINHLQNVYNTYGRPVWLTEFGPISWSGSGNWTKKDNYNFLAEFMWHAESLPWLKKYSLFQFEVGRESGTDGPNAPRGNSRNADGSLTAFGELYAGWDGVTSVLNHRSYHLQNRGVYRRVQNPGVTTPSDLVATSDTEVPSTGTQWHLIAGTAENTVRIVSRLDGRRLRYFTGTTVGMVAANNFTGQSEWRLVPDQHGWHFLEHPQSNTRLQMNSSGTLLHGSITGNTDAFKWRFVVPAVAEIAAPVFAPIPAQTVNEGEFLTFSASATDANLPVNTLTYSLVGAPSGASIDSATGVFTWTPSSPGNFNFAVRVSNGSLTHDQVVTVTVAEIIDPEILETWIVSGQSNAEGYGITQNPVSDLTPNSTLATIGRGDLNVTHNSIRMFQGANDSNGSITTSAGLTLPPRDTWHAMTATQGLAYDWGSGRGNESGLRFGPELAFGFDVQSQVDSPIALIKYARGSSSIAPSTAQSGGVYRDFDPDDSGRLNQYDKLVSTIQAAVNNLPAGQLLNLRGLVWMQGESDSATSAMASSYQANLTGFISALRTEIGTIAANSGGKLTRSAASWNELDVFIGTVRNTSPLRQMVIDAQNAVAAADPNVFTIDGHNGLSFMTVDDWGGDGVHYDTAGQVLLGERFAAAAISRIDSGVLVSESGGATSVTEGADTDTYTVTLTRAPSADVTINITTDSQVSVSPASLTFTTVNWATPQTVTVTTVNDALVESTHTGLISHDLSSSDLSFGGLPIAGVTVTIIDNDANTAPVLAAIPPQTVNEDVLLTFTASATDADLPANTLTYSLIGAPVGSSINANTGVFIWTPTAAGNFNFTVNVSDGSLTHDQPVSVTVASPLPSSSVDSDGDGLSDLLEYAFVTDPGMPNGNPFRAVGRNGGSLTLDFPWNWNATGLNWQLRHGNDLSNIASWPVVDPGTTTTIREGNIDRVTVSPAIAYPDRGFYVLEVFGN